jgi:hypothetical protein
MTVSRLVERLPLDADLERSLIEALENSFEQHPDDTRGSVWIALVLGEVASERAVPVLLRALGDDGDEELARAAGIALLRCGQSGVDAIVGALEEEGPPPELIRLGLEFLGQTGYLDDEELEFRAKSFVGEKLDALLDAGGVAAPPARSEPSASREELTAWAEGLARAAAWLGHVPVLAQLRQLDARVALGGNPTVADFIEMLAENAGSAAVRGELLPGEEAYRWAFEHRGESFKPARPDRRVGTLSVEGGGPEVELFRPLDGGDEAAGAPDDGEGGGEDEGFYYRGLTVR